MAIKNIKDLIIQAATKEFLAHGYGGTRMQNIADRAEINKALLHYHFSSKKKLYELILRAQFETMISGLFEIFASEDEFEPWLKKLIGKLLSEIGSRPHFARFMIWELSSSAKSITALFHEIMAQHSGKSILQMIQSRLERSGFGDYPASQLIMNVLSLSIYPSLARPLLEAVIGKEAFCGNDFNTKRVEEIINLIKYGILERKRGEK